MGIHYASPDYANTIECPLCGGIHTVYLKTIKKDCKCTWKKFDNWTIYLCKDCNKQYAIKE